MAYSGREAGTVASPPRAVHLFMGASSIRGSEVLDYGSQLHCAA